MSSFADEVRELVALATLGEGVLREKDEHRIVKVAAARGVSPLEARGLVDAALAALGARRPERAGADREATQGERERGGAPLAPEERARGSEEASAAAAVREALRGGLAEEQEHDAVVAEVVEPVCAGCLGRVAAADLAGGRAAREPDGRVHCRACASRLAAGLACGRCYGAIERAALAAGKARVMGGRAYHEGCAS